MKFATVLFIISHSTDRGGLCVIGAQQTYGELIILLDWTADYLRGRAGFYTFSDVFSSWFRI